MSVQPPHPIRNLADFLAWEAQVDASVCGQALDPEAETRLAQQGAHDPTPTPYYVLDELFAHYDLSERSHLLDVGCGGGRVLAYFALKALPGTATGIELDPQLAAQAQSWTNRYHQLQVLAGSVLDLDLSPYTDFYLFNPFDQGILQQFIEKVEVEVCHPCTLVHMSDNGDTWRYVGRPGWTELASGSFQNYQNARGYHVEVYDWPQHYTAWRYEGRDA